MLWIREPELGWRGKAGLVILGVFIMMSILPVIIPPEAASRLYEPFQPPCREHLLGTDDVGHDVLTLLLEGARTSLIVGFSVATITVLAGLAFSLLCFSDSLDQLVARVTDLFLVIPRLPLLIVLSALLRPGILVVILILSFFGWPFTTRVLRPVVRQMRREGFIELLRSEGFSSVYIVLRHVAPHLTPLLAVQFVLEARHAIMSEAGIGFLGFEEPTTRSWGIMLYHAFNNQYTFVSNVWTWTVLPPALALSILSLSLTLIGMELEEKYRPWMGGVLS